MLIEGKNINFRTVDVMDAEYIFTMRQDSLKTKYLSKVQGSVETQKEWIKAYKKREDEAKEYYFVIESKVSEPLGLVRLYDFRDDSFCWGSWLIKDGAPKITAIESALQVYEFGFYVLRFNKSHFDVRKGNDKVIAFHQRLGAKIVDENMTDYFFNYDKEDYAVIKEKYKRYL